MLALSISVALDTMMLSQGVAISGSHLFDHVDTLLIYSNFSSSTQPERPCNAKHSASKRWQDGYLRFHTFNKRVMAYDTTGNFIGDLHWRQDESVQDGDELELDRGVLIQVCESVEKTETDLSALYTKRTCQGSPSRSGDPYQKDSNQAASFVLRREASAMPEE
ncbi:hypothetical protein EYZ11_006484 [Aspergillus tanneri]|uniref:5'-3' DNA helicase ZGRF1-like N-terminal domain-containing protein n=1 Tax=Aspergillus tanneri TaxID=1220188 RepID=A0A4S3JFP8_9EURO|nr:hypothetical protein EYZ11_006484 [Aspergillus tanneri]